MDIDTRDNEIIIKCGIKAKLDECHYATITGDCKYPGLCSHQRPLIENIELEGGKIIEHPENFNF